MNVALSKGNSHGRRGSIGKAEWVEGSYITPAAQNSILLKQVHLDEQYQTFLSTYKLFAL